MKCPAITELNWYQTTVQLIRKKDNAVQAKVLKEFQKSFMDSFTR